MVKAICNVQLKDKKSAKDFMQMLGLNEATDQLVIETVCIVMVIS